MPSMIKSPYEAVDQEESRSLVNEEIRDYHINKSERSKAESWRLRLLTSPLAFCILHGVLLLVSILLLLSSYRVLGEAKARTVAQTRAWSPYLDAVSDGYHDVHWNGSLFHDSPIKGPPTDEAQQAWHNLMKYGLISVTGEELQRAGYEPNSVQFPDASGGGYLATATGTHHLHCLHYIWEDHHIDKLPHVQRKKEAAGEMYDKHYDHCIDYIRMGIMCNYDVTMIAFNWVRDHNVPTPNGNNWHKCVNWDNVQGWLKERAVDVPEGFEWHQPPDAEPLDYNP